MKKYPESQLDFLNDHLANPEEALLALPPLVVELDHRAWMRFLGEEWLFPEISGGILLGVGDPCNGNISSDFIAVGVCFDLDKLPDANVMVWRQGAWVNISLSRLERTDEAVIWNGPLPLSAVGCFRVPTEQNRSHILAQVRLFADMELPQQPVEVISSRRIELSSPKRKIFPFGIKNVPTNWDQMRGAAAMALECVPAIGPWLQVLCDMFSEKQSLVSASAVASPWLAFAPWTSPFELESERSPLWTAIIDVLTEADFRANWRPDLILRNVCCKARELGESADRMLYLEKTTEKLLQDFGSIRDLGVKDNNLELAFQLLLLRHTPERYVSWKKDWPSIAPGAWWTGAILAGYLCGYRALPLNLRGGVEARKFIALRTWYLADKKTSSDWKKANESSLSWTQSVDRFNVVNGDVVILSHKMSNRGRWYELDWRDTTVLGHAEIVAKQYCPELISRVLVLGEGSYDVFGHGVENINISQQRFHVTSSVEIAVGERAHFILKLDVNSFRNWLATASLHYPIPSPPEAPSTYAAFVDSSAESVSSRRKTSAIKDVVGEEKIILDGAPVGLKVIEDFLTSKEESSLLSCIEKSPWDDSMRRRVQHYGWRYDYKARKIDPSAYLGPLPKWAQNLARKLVKAGHISALPDQVIVNEYVGNQGISKHIDCKECFLGPIVTISLLESWEMIFSRRHKQDVETKYKVVLGRRSAAVMSGESRTDWFHEIPKRTKEAGVSRERRISITFRKVNVG
ncbi:alpha-ketoglutarate-dependent dioxygenase AlkB [Pseudomonas shirazensis]